MMSRIVIGIFILALFSGPVLAQKETPAAPAQKPVKTMIDYKTELKLTEAQITEVKNALLNFQETIKTQRAALVTQEKEFKDLLGAEAPLPDIKSKLRQISDTRFNLRYADVLTSRRVTEALTPEQMNKWREIQKQVRAKK